jgi:hypothetical protein
LPLVTLCVFRERPTHNFRVAGGVETDQEDLEIVRRLSFAL